MSIHLLNHWTTSLGWTVLMLIVWTLFVPRPVSVATFFLLGSTGFLVLIAGSALWTRSRPSPSMAQILGEVDSTASTLEGKV
jgi:hypothetical protein